MPELLKCDSTTAASSVVTLSADAAPAQVERLKAAGATAYLTKPIDIDLLLRTIKSTLSARSCERQEQRVSH